ncbi:MAG: ABC transporter substrate-binding protein [Pyrobaculum sp.]
MDTKFIITTALAVAALAAASLAYFQISTVGEGLKNVQTSIIDLQKSLTQLEDSITKMREESRRVLDERLANLERDIVSLQDTAAQLLELWKRPYGEVPVRYAKLFSIKYDGGYYILRDGLGRVILLAPRGAADKKLYVEKYRPDVVVEYPVERVVHFSSTHVGLVYRLYVESGDPQLLRSIKGIAWGGVYEWHLKEIDEMLKNGTIKDVGVTQSPDYEKILALRPDVVFIYFYPGPFGTEAVVERLKALGLPVVVVNEFQEESPLGRFEWIKFFAAFYNRTDLAVKIFNSVEGRWNSLVNLVADLDRPRVAWFIIFGGVLYPAGPSARELIRLAGGRYAYANYSRVDMEVVLKHRNDVDILIWSGYGVQSVEDLGKVDRRLLELRPVVQGKAYAYSKAFYQLSHVYPERLLEELIWIIHPEVAPPGEFTLFVPLR